MKANWDTIGIKDVILGADGKHWTITERTLKGGKIGVRMRRDDGKEYAGTPSGEVEVIQRGDRMHDDAVNIIDHVFGGVAVSRELDDGRQVCPLEYTSPATLHAHLRVFHNMEIPRDETDLAALDRVHLNIHVHEQSAGAYEPHIHDADWKVTT